MKVLRTCEIFLGFLFKNKKGNEVADNLAKEERKRGIHKQHWLIMPQFLNFVLLKDLCFSNSVFNSSFQIKGNNLLVDTNISTQLEEIRETNSLENQV